MLQSDKSFRILWPLEPNEHCTLKQRLPNVVQTSWTFGQRWVDVLLTSRVHGKGIRIPQQNESIVRIRDVQILLVITFNSVQVTARCNEIKTCRFPKSSALKCFS